MSNPRTDLAVAARELRSFLATDQIHKQIINALPRGIKAERVIRAAMTTIQSNPYLLQCSQVSLFKGILQAAELGLELSGPLGHAYLVPRYNKREGTWEATFQVGYRGLITLACRTPTISHITVYAVHENDEFSIQYGTSPKLHHRPAPGARGAEVGYYTICFYRHGQYDAEYMSRKEVEEHAGRFAASSKPGTPWIEHFGAMALKTVIRRLCKRLPMTVEATNAAVADEYNEAGVVVTMPAATLPNRGAEAIAAIDAANPSLSDDRTELDAQASITDEE